MKETTLFSILSAKSQESAASTPLFSAPESPEKKRAERWLSAQLARMKREGVFAEVATITPELAELLMARNPGNRPLSELGATRVQADLKSGAFELNGETIIVSDTGELNDGQHRLTACIRSGVAFKTVIVFGVKRATRTTLNQGIKRTIGAQLAIEGFKNANHLAHAARILWQYRALGLISQAPEKQPTPAEMQDIARDTPELMDSLNVGARAAKRVRVSQGLMGALHRIFADISPAGADEFFEKLADGDGLRKTDAVYRLREALMNNATAKAKLPSSEIAAITVKAWNAFRSGKPVRQLGWRSRGDGAEEFPVAR